VAALVALVVVSNRVLVTGALVVRTCKFGGVS
ncbi:MAG: hypothetical protein QOG14_4387, partial [Mycobacterium sp.]|nr:hypothetical protein [Mycobacterium sp.]